MPPFIKWPSWLILIIKKRLYLIVPLIGLTISNYVKDYKSGQKDKEIMLLTTEKDNLKDVVSTLILNEVSKAGFIEQTNLIFWVKELIPDTNEFKIIYVSPSYKMFIPKKMSHYELFGRTGRYIDLAFGDEYQKNDWVAAQLEMPKVFNEPFRYNGVGAIKRGDFLKGRIKNTGDRVLVFGLFVKEVK